MFKVILRYEFSDMTNVLNACVFRQQSPVLMITSITRYNMWLQDIMRTSSANFSTDSKHYRHHLLVCLSLWFERTGLIFVFRTTNLHTCNPLNPKLTTFSSRFHYQTSSLGQITVTNYWNLCADQAIQAISGTWYCTNSRLKNTIGAWNDRLAISFRISPRQIDRDQFS